MCVQYQLRVQLSDWLIMLIYYYISPTVIYRLYSHQLYNIIFQIQIQTNHQSRIRLITTRNFEL